MLARAGDLEEIIFATLSGERLARWETVFPWPEWRSNRLKSASKLIAREFAELAGDSRP